MVSLTAWLLFRRPAAVFAGLLTGGALFATMLGLILLPLSLIGLFFIIGILGFSPFVTSFVFWRNALVAYRTAQQGSSKLRVRLPFLAGLTITCAGPFVFQTYVSLEVARGTELVLSADSQRGLSIQRTFGILSRFDQMISAYESEPDPTRRQRLAAMYLDLTGVDIESRSVLLRD